MLLRVVGSVALLAFGGCKATDATPPPDAAPADEDAGFDEADGGCVSDASPEALTFDPSKLDRTCSIDSDCTIFLGQVPDYGVGVCRVNSCVAARNTPAANAVAANARSGCCSSSGAPDNGYCPNEAAACRDGLCTEISTCAGGGPLAQPVCPPPDGGADAGAVDADRD
jgi:hypothetical protein